MRIVVALLMVLLLNPQAQAADDLALQAMETLRRGFADSYDFSAELKQEKKLALMKHVLVSRGVVRFKKPDLFFMEIYPPHASRLLLKGDVMTMRLVEQGVTNRVTLPPDESLKKWFAFLSKPLVALPEGLRVRAERRGNLWAMQIFPQGKGAVQQITLRFDQDGKMRQIVIEERNRDRTTLTFSKMRRNVGLLDKDFKVE